MAHQLSTKNAFTNKSSAWGLSEPSPCKKRRLGPSKGETKPQGEKRETRQGFAIAVPRGQAILKGENLLKIRKKKWGTSWEKKGGVQRPSPGNQSGVDHLGASEKILDKKNKQGGGKKIYDFAEEKNNV